jgi:two-component system OmpR family response regulator
MRLLIVEDHPKMAAQLLRALRGEGMATDVAITGEDAVWMAGATPYDVVVLDVMLPGIDGFETCRRLRSGGVRAPVLMLTARDGLADRIAGLDGGADDYLGKPFALGELIARIRALARRGEVAHAPMLRVGTLRLDPATRSVWRGEQPIDLPVKCFALLESFMRSPGVVLSRLALLESAWDAGYENRSNVVDVHVRRLRGRIDEPFGTESIETVRGVGYRLRADGGAA